MWNKRPKVFLGMSPKKDKLPTGNAESFRRERVFVAMSGGVDSSLSATLLTEQGYDVTGVFIKVWQPEWLTCTWRSDRHDAMRVCAKLGIPFQTVYLEEEYKKEVVDYMIREYTAGRTPNPDVMCNKHIKFGSFLEKAREMGADMIATGHYARINRGSQNSDRESPEGREQLKLLTGKDTNKDQSYFLWTLGQEELSHTLFPIGELEKPKVREEASKRGLHVADKKDSQGLCFIGKVDMREFLKHYISVVPGNVLDENGNRIGKHEGALLYTLGQRHGFEVTKKGPDDGAHYVVGKDIGSNTITVSNEYKRDDSGVKKFALVQVNWIADEPEIKKLYKARIRYRQTLQSCRVEKHKTRKEKSESWTVVFDEPQKGVASGQSLVLYHGDECLGGGIIV